jgi:hypothetical protein
MKIQLFTNGKGLIRGDDSKRIKSEVEGTLEIGSAVIKIEPSIDNVMPQLFNGCSGHYNARFTSASGCVYQLERVTVKGGRIVPPSQTSVELAELRSRAEMLEERCAILENTVCELSNIFDTNALNFLIK